MLSDVGFSELVNKLSLTIVLFFLNQKVMGEWKRFEEGINMILQIPNFNLDINVSVFETNIRILGYAVCWFPGG
jgi:hypothetical protein